MPKIQRALLSVSDKAGLIPFALGLHKLGIEIISTGGTAKALQAENIPTQEVSSITGFPEIMDGRVKTLHPLVHGAILGKRDFHADIAKAQGINWIDLVVVNLYPFQDVIKDSYVTLGDAIENIDIGGPAMIRSAAKNMAEVGVVVDPNDYDDVLSALTKAQMLSDTQCKNLAIKAFGHTASYDAAIHQHFSSAEDDFAEQEIIALEKPMPLRYGENPHQKACAYQLKGSETSLLTATQLQGKALSYNNLVDTHASLKCLNSFEKPTCVIVKHANPCGVASDDDIAGAFNRALEADAMSAFGGIIALNRTCDAKTARAITASFFEVVVAPSFDEEAKTILANKKNLRVLVQPQKTPNASMQVQVLDSFALMQEPDTHTLNLSDLRCVTKCKPTDAAMEDVLFAWRVVKHVKSNAIVVAKNQQTLGIGPGQVSRIEAVNHALQKSCHVASGAVLASDAFFPFKDSIECIHASGIECLIQPGGSIKDEEVIQACDELGIAMLFTDIRCFYH